MAGMGFCSSSLHSPTSSSTRLPWSGTICLSSPHRSDHARGRHVLYEPPVPIATAPASALTASHSTYSTSCGCTAVRFSSTPGASHYPYRPGAQPQITPLRALCSPFHRLPSPLLTGRSKSDLEPGRLPAQASRGC